MSRPLYSTLLLACICNPIHADALPPPNVNCNYHIGSTTTKIDNALVATWAKKAAQQSFEFSPDAIDAQLTGLKSCFTEQGWLGFSNALLKSGNVAAIKSQHLTVSSLAEGEAQVSLIKENQWKVTLPLHVVYQNDKEKLTQQLTVTVLVGRKPTGDLGIMQVIAAPIQATPTQHVPAVQPTPPTLSAPVPAAPAPTINPTTKL